MLPSERALADLMVRDLDARLTLTHENDTLRSGTTSQDDNRIADLNRRLQAETAEIDFRKVELLNLKGCMDPRSSSYKPYFIKHDPASCR